MELFDFVEANIQALPCGEYENVIKSLDEKLGTADDSEIGYFVDVDLERTDFMKTSCYIFINLRIY